MKKTYSFLLLIFVIATKIPVKAQNWQWAKQIGSTNAYDGGISTIDNSHSIYYAGGFNGSTCYFDTDTLYHSDGKCFIIKYSGNGTKQWLVQLDIDVQTISAIQFDANSQSIVIYGRFAGQADFQNSIIINSTGYDDFFIARFNLIGTCLYAKAIGSTATDNELGGMLVSSSGDIYVTGICRNNWNIDGIPVNAGGFITHLNPAGIATWAYKKFTGIQIGEIELFQNDLILGGVTRSDTIQVDAAISISNTAEDAFLARMTSAGNISWYKRYGGKSDDYLYGIVTDFSLDAIYFTGYFNDTAKFDNDTLTAANGFYDFFLAKADGNGNLQWMNQSNSTGSAGANSIFLTAGSDNTLYIGGRFSGNATFGTINTTANTFSDMYVARYNDAGDCIGLINFGEGQTTSGCEDGSSIIVNGVFSGSVTIGPQSFTAYGFNSDIFVAKHDAIVNNGELERPALFTHSLLIYANPNKGTFNIKVPDEVKNFSDTWLIVYDISGRIISKFSLDKNDMSRPRFNVKNAGKGSYVVELIQGSSKYIGKLIIE